MDKRSHEDLVVEVGHEDLLRVEEDKGGCLKCLECIPFFGAFVKDGVSETNPWAKFVGEFKVLEEFLDSKTGWGWYVPKFLDALFRGIGQVVFCNNPVTGLVVLISLFFANPIVGLASTVAATTAIITAIVFQQEVGYIKAGLSTYNAVLVGSVTASIWPGELSFVIWAFIILGSALTVFVNTSLGNLLSSFKSPLPSLTFPFNIVALLLFATLLPTFGPGPGLSSNSTGPAALELVAQGPDLLNSLNNSLSRTTREAAAVGGAAAQSGDVGKIYVDRGSLDWGLTLQGICLSMGQVYGVNNLIASVLMYCATFIYSPTLFMMSWLGAILATIFGIVFTAAPYDLVYNGLWGFNGILSATAVGGFFFVFTCHSFGTAMANVILTAIIQQALALAFAPVKLPFFTLPFVISTFIFLQMTATGDNLRRVLNITTPEIQRKEYLTELGIIPPNEKGKEGENGVEEKELVLKEVKVIMEDPPKDAEKEEKTDEVKTE